MFDSISSRKLPLGINLNDKSVDVPLSTGEVGRKTELKFYEVYYMPIESRQRNDLATELLQ